MTRITITKCSCGHRGCRDWWLSGIGKFVQGSGFDQDEAQRIADALNAQDPSQFVPIPDGPDAARIEAWGRVTSQRQALEIMMEHGTDFGDPYYRHISDAILAMAERVTGARKLS